MILTQFDPAPVAVINPSDFRNKVEGMPKVAIACYSCVTFDRMIQDLDTEIVSELSMERQNTSPGQITPGSGSSASTLL